MKSPLPCLALAVPLTLFATEHCVNSPDERLAFLVSDDADLRYCVELDGGPWGRGKSWPTTWSRRLQPPLRRPRPNQPQTGAFTGRGRRVTRLDRQAPPRLRSKRCGKINKTPPAPILPTTPLP